MSGTKEEVEGLSSGEEEEECLVNFGFDLPGYLDNLEEEMEAWWNRVPVEEMLLAIDREVERMNMQMTRRTEGERRRYSKL